MEEKVSNPTKHVTLMYRAFRRLWLNYIWQTFLATLSMICIALMLTFEHAVIISSIASTAFIVFAMPKSITAKPRNVIGGHLASFGCGVASLLVLQSLSLPHLLAYALSVGLSMFIMVATDTEHPPAAGTAMGVVLSGFSWRIFLSLMTSITVLALLHKLLSPYLKDLV